MTQSKKRRLGALAIILFGLTAVIDFPADAAPAAPASKNAPGPMLPGANSHDPINIDAGKLDYYDKEQKMIYTGAVVAVQGDSTLKATKLTIFLTKEDPATPGAPPPPPSSSDTPSTSGSSVRHMDAVGPVTLISKDQVGTGDNGTYDKPANRVTLTGNVTLSQGTNVTKGDRLVYDLTTGQAQVFSGQTYGRVKSIFIPGSGAPGDATPDPHKKVPPAKPKPAGTASTQ